MRPLETLLVEAGIDVGKRPDEARALRLVSKLAKERSFPAGFWHPEDADGLADVMRGCLADLGLAPDVVSDALIASLVEQFARLDDEDAARRHQIGAALHVVNRALTGRRFYAFAEGVPGWESDEPVWILLSPEEHALLVGTGLFHPPVGIEREYDD
jgi:hypothetical protein